MTIQFKLPIEYVKHKRLSNNITDNIDAKSIYLKTFNPITEQGKEIINTIYQYTTADKKFLVDTQKLNSLKNNISINISKIKLFSNEFNHIQNIQKFNSQFQYIDYKYLDFLNNNENALHILGIYNFTSPIINIVTPLVIIIIPFFILKLKNIEITFKSYKEFLFETIFKKFNINNFANASIRTKLYLCITIVFYIIGIYQNIMSCIKFYKNNNYINSFFTKCKEYFSYINNEQKIFIRYVEQNKSYKNFLDDLTINNKNIINIQSQLEAIKTYSIGKKMKLFYKFKSDSTFIDTCNYSLSFVGYLDNINGFINNNSLNNCFFHNKTIFKNFYMPLDNTNVIKNSCNLKRNYIISGPNAAGKTTILKSLLLNTLLSQQIGMGYYDAACIYPSHHFHCYLNIPDTNNRDSLFQAEARQCKNILDEIKKHPTEHHFIIFDELYSGTNPEQAVKSAYSYLKYLGEFKNVSFLLTTHFYALCNKIDKNNKQIMNISMKTNNINNENIYLYKLQKGISNRKSGFDILKKMNYPKRIINTLENS
jgi:DNA mismatch repair protein MutS